MNDVACDFVRIKDAQKQLAQTSLISILDIDLDILDIDIDFKLIHTLQT